MPNRTKIEEIMTKGVFTVQRTDTVKKADDIIKDQNVRHVPVLDEDKFFGLITERTLMEYTLRRIYDYDDNIDEVGLNKISDFTNILEKNVHLVYPEDSVQKAVEIMLKKKMDCLPVVDWKKNLVGILTSLDILLFFLNHFKNEQ
jgi:CBS domain-containing membrane protein